MIDTVSGCIEFSLFFLKNVNIEQEVNWPFLSTISYTYLRASRQSSRYLAAIYLGTETRSKLCCIVILILFWVNQIRRLNSSDHIRYVVQQDRPKKLPLLSASHMPIWKTIIKISTWITTNKWNMDISFVYFCNSIDVPITSTLWAHRYDALLFFICFGYVLLSYCYIWSLTITKLNTVIQAKIWKRKERLDWRLWSLFETMCKSTHIFKECFVKILLQYPITVRVIC